MTDCLKKKKKGREAEKENEALMEALGLSVTKQMLDRKAICSRKDCGSFLLEALIPINIS